MMRSSWAIPASWRRRIGGAALLLLLLLLSIPLWAQSFWVDRIILKTGPCTISSGSAAPTGGANCDVYIRTATPWGIYTKVSGTWTGIVGGSGTGTAIVGGSGTGIVTSVGLALPAQLTVTVSPITTSGSLTATWATETANYIFAGPTTGAVATPTFRALVAADIPTIAWTGVSKSGSSLADLATASATDLTSGTLPDGRFPATLPAVSGASLGNLSATALASGTVPLARLTGLTHTQLDASAGVLWTQLNLTGSSLADLTTKNSSALTFNASVSPSVGATYTLGSSTYRWAGLYAEELNVQNLVAQSVTSSIGGELLVAPTTYVTTDVAPADVTITVNNNNLTNGDRIYMAAYGYAEWMAITSAASGGGPYVYSVTRNLNGTGSHVWHAGDAVIDTGTTGAGIIDQRAGTGVLSRLYGPTIEGIVRTGTTYSNMATRWAVGNLNSLYDYVTTTYGFAAGDYTATWIAIDPTNGFRLNNGATSLLSANAGGNMTLAGSLAVTGSITAGYATMNTNGYGVTPTTLLAFGRSFHFLDSQWPANTLNFGLYGSESGSARTASVLATAYNNGSSTASAKTSLMALNYPGTGSSEIAANADLTTATIALTATVPGGGTGSIALTAGTATLTLPSTGTLAASGAVNAVSGFQANGTAGVTKSCNSAIVSTGGIITACTTDPSPEVIALQQQIDQLRQEIASVRSGGVR